MRWEKVQWPYNTHWTVKHPLNLKTRYLGWIRYWDANPVPTSAMADDAITGPPNGHTIYRKVRKPTGRWLIYLEVVETVSTEDVASRIWHYTRVYVSRFTRVSVCTCMHIPGPLFCNIHILAMSNDIYIYKLKNKYLPTHKYTQERRKEARKCFI